MLNRTLMDLSIKPNTLRAGFDKLTFKTLLKIEDKQYFEGDLKPFFYVVKRGDIDGIIGEVVFEDTSNMVTVEEYLNVVKVYRPKFFVILYSDSNMRDIKNIELSRYNVKHSVFKNINIFIGLRDDFPFYTELLEIRLGEVKVGKCIDITLLSQKIAEKIVLYFMGLDISEQSKQFRDLIFEEYGGPILC